MNNLFLNNSVFLPVSESEDDVLISCRKQYDDGKFSTIDKWNRKGKFGRAYGLPKHKDVLRWRPICPSYFEGSNAEGKRVARAVNCMLWRIPDAMHFNLRSTTEVMTRIYNINKGLKKDEVLVGGSFDIKEMFSNFSHQFILQSLQWMLEFWKSQVFVGVLVCLRGKKVRLAKGKGEDG
ncbi:hypothetical protein CBR_g45755 [Chara braunii]|uniref:Reverse transcriptase domain-containing protein n=1 Tax=Chara braunii TaxID=69332 RepID=A0A388LZC1_CHABU|nr:hypothetical protein CBR_g45755 [Chara braunii]|eukprot:GBG87603.1 hypothetical protein CBR_g45755 [Chara braunii]